MAIRTGTKRNAFVRMIPLTKKLYFRPIGTKRHHLRGAGGSTGRRFNAEGKSTGNFATLAASTLASLRVSFLDEVEPLPPPTLSLRVSFLDEVEPLPPPTQQRAGLLDNFESMCRVHFLTNARQ